MGRWPLILGASLLAVLMASPAMAAGGADMAQAVSAAIVRCWNPPPGASGSVTVRFELGRDGRVVGTPHVTGLASPGFADSAVHAVTFCQPYRLPPERFSDWQHAVVKLSVGAR